MTESTIKTLPAVHRRFVAVFHKWHVTSGGFDQVQLRAVDREQAHDEACRIFHDKRDGFYAQDFCLVELESTERLARRLTWRERITGRLVQ